MVFPSGLNAITPVTNPGMCSTRPGPSATDHRDTESTELRTANERPSGLVVAYSNDGVRVPVRVTGLASRYERIVMRPLSAVMSRPSAPTKKILRPKSLPTLNSASFFPVFIDQTIDENRFVVASIVPRLLNTRSRAGVYELGGSGCVHPGASARGGILARSLATAALSLSRREKTLFPSRGRQT